MSLVYIKQGHSQSIYFDEPRLINKIQAPVPFRPRMDATCKVSLTLLIILISTRTKNSQPAFGDFHPMTIPVM